MKRAPIVLSATVAGLAATLGFQTQTPAAPTSAAATTQAATTASTGSNASSSSSAATAATASSASTATKTATSAVESNQYGNVQLKVTITSGKITAVTAVQIPDGDPKSAEINAAAEPILQQSALTAQSANIDAVSGATYTSNSYKAALKSALDKANFSTSTATGS